MQFQNRLGDIASGSTIRIDPIDATLTAAVAAGGTDTVTIAPPAGWIYRVKSMELFASAPAGATTGTHGFVIFAKAGITEYTVFDGWSKYSNKVWFGRGGWKVANYLAFPVGPAAQQLALAALLATEDAPLKVFYRNATDVAQNSSRVLMFTFERIAV